MLCTLAEFKALYNVSGTGDDAVITRIIEGVSGQLAGAAGRVCAGAACMEKGSITEYISVDGPTVTALSLAARPIVAIWSIKEAIYGAFAGADAMVENDDYQISRGSGMIYRVGSSWMEGRLTVQAIYIGGYTPAGDVPGEGETALPADIVDAALQQSGFVWQRRGSLGLSGQSVQGGSVSTYATDKLLPGVAATMKRYRRFL